MDPATAAVIAKAVRSRGGRNAIKTGAIVTGAFAVLCGGCIGGLAPLATGGARGRPAGPCASTVPALSPVGEWTEQQTANAGAIIAEGKTLGVPVRGWVIAVATAIAESTLIAVPHGDQAGPDSRGLFQQRDPWGPLEVRMDPRGSARLFYTGGMGGQRGLLGVPGWETMPLTDAAWEVQRSAYPDGYAKHEDAATALVSALSGEIIADRGCAPGTVVGGYALPLAPEHVNNPGPHHDYPAIDFSVPTGTTVYAVTGGRVTLPNDPYGWGLGIQITDGAGHVWIYGHNSQILVADGATVAPGDIIAMSGNTGHSTGPHLHLELRRAPGGEKVCPHALVNALDAGQVPPPVESLATTGCIGPSLR